MAAEQEGKRKIQSWLAQPEKRLRFLVGDFDFTNLRFRLPFHQLT